MGYLLVECGGIVADRVWWVIGWQGVVKNWLVRVRLELLSCRVWWDIDW